MTTPRKVRWLIAHQPVELFVRTAEAFRAELNKTIPGQIDLEIVTVPEYLAQRGEPSPLSTILEHNSEDSGAAVNALFAALNDDIQMSQTQIVLVAHKDPAFYALDLPFMFEDHDHVSRVAEGPIGKELLDNLERVSDVKGLAFTYSGGYRVIGSDTMIAGLKDLADKTVVVSAPGARADTLESVGAEAKIVSPHIWGDYDRVPADADAIETTYLRFPEGKYVLKTNHSMFMTTIMTNKNFWNSLTEEQQHAFEEAAKVTASVERAWAVRDAEAYELNAVSNGVTITDLSEEDTTLLKHKARYSYLQFGQQYGDLIKRIRQS